MLLIHLLWFSKYIQLKREIYVQRGPGRNTKAIHPRYINACTRKPKEYYWDLGKGSPVDIVIPVLTKAITVYRFRNHRRSLLALSFLFFRGIHEIITRHVGFIVVIVIAIGILTWFFFALSFGIPYNG